MIDIILKRSLTVVEVIFICVGVYAEVTGSAAVTSIARSVNSIQKTVNSIPGEITKEVDKQSDLAYDRLDQQLRLAREDANYQVNRTRSQLLKQTGDLVASADETLATLSSVSSEASRTVSELDSVIKSSDKTLKDVDAVVSDPDLTKTIRSTRMLVDETALTMAHVRATANTINEAAPQMADSANKIAASAAGITSDVNKITADITKPRKWYQKAGAYLGDAVKIGGVIF